MPSISEGICGYGRLGPQLQPALWTPSLLESTDHGQASASLEIWASDGSSFDGPKGACYEVEAPSLSKPPPAQLYTLSISQPGNQATRQPANQRITGPRNYTGTLKGAGERCIVCREKEAPGT
jgi:hypothetical protein